MKKKDKTLLNTAETPIAEKEIDMHRLGKQLSFRSRLRALIDADILARLAVCAALLVVFSLTETTIFAKFHPFGAVPDLMLPLTIAVGISEREKWGAVFGIAAGFVIECLGGSTVTVLPLLYMLAGYFAGALTVEMFRDSLATRALYTAAGCFAHIFFTLFALYMTTEGVSFGAAMLRCVIPEFFASLLFSPLPHAAAKLSLRGFHKPREEKVE